MIVNTFTADTTHILPKFAIRPAPFPSHPAVGPERDGARPAAECPGGRPSAQRCVPPAGVCREPARQQPAQRCTEGPHGAGAAGRAAAERAPPAAGTALSAAHLERTSHFVSDVADNDVSGVCVSLVSGHHLPKNQTVGTTQTTC